MYKLIVYVPKADLDAVKQACFAAGAGRIGEYQQCSFETEGLGQFLPSAAAQPAIGEVQQLTQVSEVKLEMVCTSDCIKAAALAMIAAHPYEEPAYQIMPFITVEQL
ncbi:MAG: NGG1p interacting factor NIF3 [Pseudomonadales bacterium]|nr:NGG1p interacting factor NIF3 [Pseudomonadales bacterium]